MCDDDPACNQAVHESSGPWGQQCWLGTNVMSPILHRPLRSRACVSQPCLDECYNKNGWYPEGATQPDLTTRFTATLDCAGAADDSVALLESAGLVGAAPDRRSKALKARNPGQAKLRVLVDADDARAALERGARSSALAARAR